MLGQLEENFTGGWVLIGGLMVYLLGAEAGQSPKRVTVDADVLVRARVLTTGTRDISAWLVKHGLEFEGANALDQGHRFSGGGVSVDVLLPGGIGERAERRTVGQNVTVEVVGGPGLLHAGELVRVAYRDEDSALIPRPALDAAIVGKAKAATRLEDAQRHCQDIAFLLGLVEDPLAMSGLLSAANRGVIAEAALEVTKHEAWSYAISEPAARAAVRILGRA